MLSIAEIAPLRRVLVTGGRGFIGSHLVNCLTGHSLEVISADIVPKNSQTTGAIEVEIDIRQRDALDELFSHYRFDAVFDLASFTEAGLSAAIYERNIAVTETMTRIVEKFDIRRYVFFSTQFVFRRPNVCPSAPFEYAPTEAYGESKVISERLITTRLAPGRRLILRPTYIWGPGLERFRTGLLSRLEKRQMLISNDSKIKRYYGYVETIAEQAYRLLKTWNESSQAQVLYLSDDAISLQEFCQYLIVALGAGRFWSVSPTIIRALGEFGAVLKLAGLRSPIDRIQARELTRSFPIPIASTLALTANYRTDYTIAAERTVRWARSRVMPAI